MQQNTTTIKKIAMLLTILLIALVLSAGASRPTIPAAEAVVLWDDIPRNFKQPLAIYDVPVLEQIGNTDVVSLGWYREEVIYGFEYNSEYPSVALDQFGNVHTSYLLFNTRLNYGHNTHGDWINQTIDSGLFAGIYNDITIDNLGYPHISYQTHDPEKSLKYAFMDATGWHIETVIQIDKSEIGSYTSIALDQFGRPHISFFDLKTSLLFYAVKNTGIWDIIFFQLPDRMHPKTVIQLDRNGEAYIAFVNSPVADTEYMVLYFSINGDWYAISKNLLGQVRDFDFVLDKDDYPIFAYTVDRGQNDNVYLGFPTDSGWYESNITAGGYKLSLAVDHRNYPVVTGVLGKITRNFTPGVSGWLVDNVSEQVHIDKVASIFHNDIPHIIGSTTGQGVFYFSFVEPIVGLTAAGTNPTELGHHTYFASNIANGDQVTFNWTFGDSYTATGQNVTHKYENLGMYTASVTAQNKATSASMDLIIQVINAKIRNLSIGGAVPTVFGELNTLTARHSTGTNVTYSWDLGDGQTAQGATANHVYEAPGVYTVTLQAVNTSSSAIQTAQIAVQEPVAGLAITHTQPVTPGATVLFAATTISGTGLVYEWGFGDATWATGQSITHTLACTGIYTITLRAYNYVSEQIVQERFETPVEITPDGGCTVVAENIVLTFPPAFVPDTVKVLYQQILYDQAGHLVPLRPTFSLTLSSSVTSTITTTRIGATSYQLTVGYTDDQLGNLNPETVAVHTYAGEGWNPFPDFSDERINNRITVYPTEFGKWALLGTHALYMPVVRR